MDKFLLKAKVEEYEYLEGKYVTRWVEGYMCPDAITEEGVKYVFVEPKEGTIVFHHHLSSGDESYAYKPVYHSLFDKETVSRWTGLCDRNDKKIYEGDIVKDQYGRTKTVEFFNGRYYPFIAFPEFNCWDADECTVIGNVHDMKGNSL